MNEIKNWHDAHVENSTWGDKLSDALASGMGSWKFIIVQTIFVLAWMLLSNIGMPILLYC